MCKGSTLDSWPNRDSSNPSSAHSMIQNKYKKISRKEIQYEIIKINIKKEIE